MMYLFACILIGYLLRKFRVLREDADTMISRLVNYVFVPGLILNSFYNHCNPESLSQNLPLLLYCVVLLALCAGIGFLLAPRFAEKPEQKGIYLYSFTVVNFGFMGNALIQGLLGEDVLFRYLIFTMPASVFCYSVGVIWLTAGKKKFHPRMLINPMFITMIIGIVLGMTGCPLPSFATRTMSALAGCYSPLTMILTGYVIAGFDLKELLLKKQIYLLTLIRIVIMPLVIFFAAKAIGISGMPLTFILFFTAMPLGLNTIVYPAAYGGDKTPGAAMAVISNIAGLVTVPLILSLVL